MAEMNYGERPLHDFIVQAHDVLTAAEMQRIIEVIGSSDLWNSAGLGSNTTDPALRNSDTLDVSANRDIPEMDEINGIIYGAVAKATEFYRLAHPLLNVNSDTGYEILRYPEGTRCGDHVDSYSRRPRTLTMTIALNGGYRGGEFSLLGGEFVAKPRAGAALMFPSNFMYPHEVLPVTQGERLSIITWLI